MAIGEQLASVVSNEVVASAVKVTPPVGAVSAIYFGFTLPDVLMVLTIAYTSLQIFFLLRDKLFRRNKHRKE
jgi:hypothetical protein